LRTVARLLDDETWPARLRALALEVPPEVSMPGVVARAAVWLVLLVSTLSLTRHGVEGAAAGAFLHMVNLAFHEAGHILFMPLGSFLTSLGGSLTQVLVPLVCAGTLLVKTRDPFGAAACTWWAGENLLDLAPYIADARALEMELLGGFTGHEVEGHDWEAILGALSLLPWDVRLGRAAFALGIVVMFASLGWAAVVLARQRAAVARG
jgi:hypothetical protein